MKKDEERFAGWQERATNVEKAIANLLKTGGPWSTICILAQQMAEKYLKDWLVYNKLRFEKTHYIKGFVLERVG
jgi:HEPN domain-containing protein